MTTFRLSPSRCLDVFDYWRSVGKTRLQQSSVVVKDLKFPLLSLLARIYLDVNSTLIVANQSGLSPF